MTEGRKQLPDTAAEILSKLAKGERALAWMYGGEVGFKGTGS